MSDVGALIDYSAAVISSVSIQGVGIEEAATGHSILAGIIWPSSNIAIFVPVKIGYPVTIIKMYWGNGNVVGTNSVDVGIYDSQGNQLVHSGSTATSGASAIQSVSITSTTLEPGLYYLAMAMNGTTDKVFADNSSPVSFYRAVGIYNQSTAFTLPSTATYVGATSAYLPFIGATTKSTI